MTKRTSELSTHLLIITLNYDFPMLSVQQAVHLMFSGLSYQCYITLDELTFRRRISVFTRRVGLLFLFFVLTYNGSDGTRSVILYRLVINVTRIVDPTFCNTLTY